MKKEKLRKRSISGRSRFQNAKSCSLILKKKKDEGQKGRVKVVKKQKEKEAGYKGSLNFDEFALRRDPKREESRRRRETHKL